MKKTEIAFMSHRRFLWLAALTLITVGIIFNIINGTNFDIKFTGGAIFRYEIEETVSLSDIDPQKCADSIAQAVGKTVKVSINTTAEGESEAKTLVVTLAENASLGHTANSTISRAIRSVYPEFDITLSDSVSVDPSEGRIFVAECLLALFVAILLMMIYISLRFKKTGGILTALCGLCATIFDCSAVYFAFIVFRFPLDDNFIAALLATMGYSLNMTIVVFDRIRENKRLLGAKTPIAKIADISLNETANRNLSTVLCMVIAVLIAAIVSLIYGLESIVTFTVTLIFGVISSFFSSIAISTGLFASLIELKERRKN